MFDLLPPNLRRHLLRVGTVRELRSGESVEVRSGYVMVMAIYFWVRVRFWLRLFGRGGRVLLVGASDFSVRPSLCGGS